MGYLLQHLLTESATRVPDHEAVRYQGDALTYRELDLLTDHVAAKLRSIGVSRGDRVGLYVPKSMASVIGVFAILKAGGVYVPLDPTGPPRRAAYIARDCGIRVVLTTARIERLPDLLDEAEFIETIVLTDNDELRTSTHVEVVTWASIERGRQTRLLESSAIDCDLAYILYTSGSTGEPKGVMISHRTILTFVRWAANEFRLSPQDRVTSHAPLHFDLSTFDLYATLSAGGTVVLVPEGLSVFPEQFVELVQREEITVTYLVPSVLSLIVTYGNLAGHDLSALRIVLFAGEVFPIKHLRALVAALPHTAYYNLYGPTETNVCTYYRVRPEDVSDAASRPVPIGVACANTEVFAVDDAGARVTEPGLEGELWVRGQCVAQGYWGDPEKTARGFVWNRHQSQFADVAYRTGDIVMLDADGINWRYVGRRDHLVKSRGYRIELGEIEAALYSHPLVKEAAAVAIPDELIGNRITAFVVPTPGSDVASSELEAHCRPILPHYMLPERIELCSALPKTSTGKVDRPALARVS